MLDLPDWHSFWDVANPRQAATALAELYGEAATAAAAECAAAARSDDRDDDYRFWIAVQARLQAARRGAAETDGPRLEDRADGPAVLT